MMNESGNEPMANEQALRELIAKWRLRKNNTQGMYVDGYADALNECADELEESLAASEPGQGLPTDVGHKFIVQNGKLCFLAQTISRLDDEFQNRVNRVIDAAQEGELAAEEGTDEALPSKEAFDPRAFESWWEQS